MTPRELIILLLGFVMVAVLLRGLFVAIQVRRGQIRLTIDKNIPQNFDLEELELAELPSGGARVVNRTRDSYSWTNQVTDVSGEVVPFDAVSSTPIPILMDIVESDDRVSESLTNRDLETNQEATQNDYHDSINDLSDEIHTHSWPH